MVVLVLFECTLETAGMISVPVRLEPVSNGSRFGSVRVRFERISNLSNRSLNIHCVYKPSPITVCMIRRYLIHIHVHVCASAFIVKTVEPIIYGPRPRVSAS